MPFDPIFQNKLESKLAQKVGLESLHIGHYTIRNEKGWRENELYIEHLWLISMNRTFVGQGSIFNIKFKETRFRGIHNPEKLLQGIFTFDKNGIIKESYFENTKESSDITFEDFNSLDLFFANPGITLDGISYGIHLMAPNINTQIFVNNPSEAGWKFWVEKVWKLGKDLAMRSSEKELIRLFE